MGVVTISTDRYTVGTHWFEDTSTKWVVNTNQGASHGSYGKDDSFVGVMVFKGLQDTITGKYIESIKFTFTTSGGGTSAKNILFWESKIQTFTFDNSVMGKDIVGASLGVLGGVHGTSSGTKTESFVLNSTTNSTLFASMASYFEGGNNTLVIYNDETSSSGKGSTGYTKIQKAVLEVTYSDSPPTTNTVWYRVNNQWVKCAMYYRASSNWVRVTPYYRANNAWIQV